MNKDKAKQGKRNKINGAKFENIVRKNLELNGWIVSKWSNNVKFEKGFNIQENKLENCNGKLIQAKHKFNPYKKIMSIGNGFPDFICFRTAVNVKYDKYYHEVIGAEAKTNGYLDKEEKEKCSWLIDNHIFSKILIASKDGKGIKYKEFQNE